MTIELDISKNENVSRKLHLLKTNAINNKRTSNRYRTVDTTELMNTVENVLTKKGQEFKSEFITGMGGKGTTHALVYTLKSGINILGDDCKPRIIVLNSFNAEKALSVKIGFLRLCCLNGLFAGKSIFSESARHIKGESIEEKLRTLADKVEYALNFISTDFKNKVEEYTAIDLTPYQEVEVINNLGLSKRITEKVTLLRTGLHHRLRVEDQPRNAWTLYNVVNEVIRRYTRSEIANVNKNIKLMDNVVNLAMEAREPRALIAA